MKKITLKTGDIVRLTRDVERFPDFLVSKGSVGTVKTGVSDLVQVLMHETVKGCEPWGNVVYWYIDNGEDPTADLEKIDATSSIEKALQAAQGEFIITTHNDEDDVREFSLVGSAYGDAVTYLYDTQDDIKASIDSISYRFAFDLDAMADALAVYLEDQHDSFEGLIWYAIEQHDYLSD